MKERVVTLGLALGALLLFYALFSPKPAGLQNQPALPVSTEIRDDGYQALWRWLGTQDIPAVSFRDRYSRLSRRSKDDYGNLLIATLPQRVPARVNELRDLDAWVRQGNTLLVLAALDDTPRWALQTTGDLLDTLTRLTGLKFSVIAEKPKDDNKTDVTSRVETLRQAARSFIESQHSVIVARGSHPLFAGVAAIAAQSELPASRWKARGVDASPVLALGDRTDKAEGSSEVEPAVWLRRHGQGQVIVLAYASPLSNGLIGQRDNARLFANIVGWTLSAHGAVLFDDAHQGLVDYYDGKAFFADPRLHRTLLWLAVLWLLFVLGWQRLRPRAEAWNPMDVTTFIKVTGGFIAARVQPNAAGLRLFENFFNRIRQRLSLPRNGEPVWDWLTAQAGVSVRDLQSLRQLYARAQTRQRVDLIQLQNCLTRMAGSLL